LKSFHLTLGGKRHAVSVEREAEPDRLKITIDGETHIVEVEEDGPSTPAPGARAAPPPRPAGARPSGSGGGRVLAPLPGSVLSVAAAAGDAVAAGDKLLVLEAMKMENVITAEMDGTVSAVRVGQGDKVEAGQELMVIE
jgi:biotin carboxyl carrier protein